jgi:hypothetical protein
VKRVSHKAAYKCNWHVRQLEHEAKLVERCRNPEVATILETGIRAFCEDAKAAFNASSDPDARRAFLAGRIERVIYRKHQVTLVGAVPLPSMDGTRRQFSPGCGRRETEP